MKSGGQLKRTTGLARTGQLKRTSMKRSRPKRRIAQERVEREAFHAVSRGRLCVVCGLEVVRFSHHVLLEQHLPEHLKNDTRNALAVGDRCHMRHHAAVERIPAECLSETNIQFANDVLGAGAGAYLNRYYGSALQQPEGDSE